VVSAEGEEGETRIALQLYFENVVLMTSF